MKHTKQFIEDAIKGGWKENCKGWHFWANKVTHTGTNGFNEQSLTFHEILLDPLAWQAVGKTRGWTEYPTKRNVIGDSWKEYIHRFIDHLADGHSIEEALGLIS